MLYPYGNGGRQGVNQRKPGLQRFPWIDND